MWVFVLSFEAQAIRVAGAAAAAGAVAGAGDRTAFGCLLLALVHGPCDLARVD